MDVQAVRSVLNFEKVYAQNVSYKRSDTLENKPSYKLNYKINSNIKQFEENNIQKYKVTMIFQISSKNDEINLYVEICGIFAFQPGEDTGKVTNQRILERNTLSILFPYLRSFISTFTAQAGINTIIIPPININALLKANESEKEKENCQSTS